MTDFRKAERLVKDAVALLRAADAELEDCDLKWEIQGSLLHLLDDFNWATGEYSYPWTQDES